MYKSEILADSLSPQGERLTTFKVTFPRFILAEFNTHRMFSRNSASSRAIPFKKMVKMVQENPFIPIAWQKDHKGMQGTEYLDEERSSNANSNWMKAVQDACEAAKMIHENYFNDEDSKVTKQLCNRILEPFMWHTAIITSGEKGLDNFFKLRCPQYQFPFSESKEYKSKNDVLEANRFAASLSNLEWLQANKSQAEIHIQAIAELMWDSYNESTPKHLKAGEWHIPYGDKMDWDLDKSEFQKFYYNYGKEDDEELLKAKIATARCARISYETLGDNPVIDYNKDIELHDNLVKMEHWSPLEHIARCMTEEEWNKYNNGEILEHNPNDFSKASHEAKGWCRNFRGFIQYRHLVDK